MQSLLLGDFEAVALLLIEYYRERLMEFYRSVLTLTNFFFFLENAKINKNSKLISFILPPHSLLVEIGGRRVFRTVLLIFGRRIIMDRVGRARNDSVDEQA